MVIDAHVHMGHIRQLGTVRSYITYMPGDLSNLDVLGPEIVLKSMDELGIDKSVVFSIRLNNRDYSRENEWITKIVRQYPDRFIGFAFINPLGGDQAVEHLKRCINEWGMKGIKLQPVHHGYQIYGGTHDALVNPIVEQAAKFKLPIIIHSGAYAFGHPSFIGLLAGAFPEVTVIIAHCGSSPESFGFGIRSSIQVAREHSNIILETSQQPTVLRIKEAIESLGAERVVFGSDTPWSVPELELMKIKAMRLRENQERLVLGGNMARILGVDER